MKWSIDWFLNRFYIFSKQLSFIFSRFLLSFLSKPLDFVLRVISAFFVFLIIIINSTFSLFMFFFNFFFNTVFLFFLGLLSSAIDGFFFNYRPVSRMYSFLSQLFNSLFNNLIKPFNFIFTFLYKSTLDFFFF